MAPESKYHDLWKKADFKIYYGGRDAAKSWAIAEYLVRRAAVEPLRILCTREFQNSIKDSVHHLLVATIERLGLSKWFDVTQTAIKSRCGAEFFFKGIHHNTHEIKSTEAIDICWPEEAQHMSDESWEVLIPTIRKEGSEIIVSFNVTDEQAPTHVRMITNTPPGSVIHHVNFDANPYLTDKSKRAIAYLKSKDLDAYNHVYLGMPKKISDAIIFGKCCVVEAFPDTLWKKANRLHFGADHGFARDPAVLIRFFIIDNILYIEHEAFGVGVEFAGEMSEDGRGELEQLWDSVPGARDWPIKADNSRPETISFMRGKGFNVTAADKWKGSVEDGIAHLKGFRKIVIHERCKHMQEEARLYSFKKDPKTGEVLPIIVDANNHGWDAARYGLDGHIQRRGDLGLWARLGQPG